MSIPGGGGGIAVLVENPYGEKECDDSTGTGFTKVDESPSALFDESCFPDKSV